MTLRQVQLAHVKYLGAQVRTAEAREKLRESVREARQRYSVAEIGQALGMTRQGVYDLLKR